MNSPEGRFVSLPSRLLAVDVVHDDQRGIHAELEAWGRWSIDSRGRVKCGSAEKSYENRSGYRSFNYPSVDEMMPALPNPRMRQIDRAVLGLPEQHRNTCRYYYVLGLRPEVICRRVVIRHADFGRWMRDCRAMVANRLRFLGG